MEGKRLIRSLTLRNLLSFGDEKQTIELQPLNVLIGPNASGKSNLLEVISFLRATPKDLTAPIREGGGVEEWIWKGVRGSTSAVINAEIDYVNHKFNLNHSMEIDKNGQRLAIHHENINDIHDEGERPNFDFMYSYEGDGEGILEKKMVNGEPLDFGWNNLKGDQSILSQVKDPDRFPELKYLSEQYDKIKVYRIPFAGSSMALRKPQPTDLPEDFLLEDGSNLGLIFNDLDHRRTKPLILEKLRRFYESIDDVTAKIFGNTILLYLHERGLSRPVPITRLSDGTINYLCLLAILCHPDPPPLICMEEPELGMHPDVIPIIAELLIEASQRTQLIVTTHSVDLVSALSETPEAILVCERDESGSHLRRLDPERLEKWLEDYSLGELWRSGEIGGNRW